jgi:hypothetical protein
MGSHGKVINLTNGWRIKRSQASNRVDQCLSEWVEEGFSIRDLTLSETVIRRSEQARIREELPFAEWHGLIYEPSKTAVVDRQAQRELVQSANWFAGPPPKEFSNG